MWRSKIIQRIIDKYYFGTPSGSRVVVCFLFEWHLLKIFPTQLRCFHAPQTRHWQTFVLFDCLLLSSFFFSINQCILETLRPRFVLAFSEICSHSLDDHQRKLKSRSVYLTWESSTKLSGAPFPAHPGMEVTKALLVNFWIKEKIYFAKLLVLSYETHYYLSKVTTAKLQLHLSNMNAIFNRQPGFWFYRKKNGKIIERENCCQYPHPRLKGD